MEEWLTKQEVEEKYKHISLHTFPFESIIIKVIPQIGNPFSDRWKFLKGLFYITDDGYYFQYKDICRGQISMEQDGQPFDILLDGVLRYVFPLAYMNSSTLITGYILTLLSEGKLYGGKDRSNNIYFLFSDFWYTYLPKSHWRREYEKRFNYNDGSIKKTVFWNLPIVGDKEVIEKTHFEGLYLIPINEEDTKTPNDFYDRYLAIKNSLGYYQLYDKKYNKLSGVFFNELIYGKYEFFYSSGDSHGVDDFIIRKDNKWGCLDGDGNLIIPCKYDKIQHFYYCGHPDSGLYEIWQDNKMGLCDDKGKILIPCQYDKIIHIGYYAPILEVRKEGFSFLWILINGRCCQISPKIKRNTEYESLEDDFLNKYLYLAGKSNEKYNILRISYQDHPQHGRITPITHYDFNKIEQCQSVLKRILATDNNV